MWSKSQRVFSIWSYPQKSQQNHWKLKDSDLVRIFEDGTSLKITSAITHPYHSYHGAIYNKKILSSYNVLAPQNF